MNKLFSDLRTMAIGGGVGGRGLALAWVSAFGLVTAGMVLGNKWSGVRGYWNHRRKSYANDLMIKRDSILRRLPLELDRKQALFLDGIRHSAEIAHLAYERLRGLLTKIASDENSEHEKGELYTAAFLDAWSVVDSIHRFQDLYRLFPEARMVEADPSDQKDREALQRVRDVRNVTDHLGQRMDYVLSRKSAAMGILSWCTIISPDQGTGVICTIIPGTIGCQSGPIVNPCGKNVELPSGMVSITAGEHTADLSEAMTVLSHRVSEIENQMEIFVDANNLKESQAGADLLIQLSISFDNSSKTQDKNI